jgi:hypothetical protein
MILPFLGEEESKKDGQCVVLGGLYFALFGVWRFGIYANTVLHKTTSVAADT